MSQCPLCLRGDRRAWAMAMSPDSAVLTTPLITGFVESLKRAGVVSPRYAALASLAVGIAASLAAFVAGPDGRALYDAVLQGAAVGLAASGLYSVANAATRRSAGQADPEIVQKQGDQ